MMFRPTMLLPILLAPVFLALAGPALGEDALKSAPPPPPSVSVVTAQTRELASDVVVTGTLVPRETVVVGADVDGLRVEQLLADEGDSVAAGAVLARLSTDVIAIELARNDSQIARTEAAMAQAESQIAEAESATVEADAALARSRPLQAKGIVGQDILDQRVSAAAAAKARLAAARQGLAVAEADRALTLAERRELELRREKTQVKAPTAGLVLSRAVRLGSIVSASGGGLFEIARDGLIELDAEVGETVLNQLQTGQPVRVTLAGAKDAVGGTVRLVSPQVDAATRLGRVRVALPPSPALRAGMFARGLIEVARSKGVVVPQTAVVIDGDTAVVQVVKSGVVESRTVALGISTGDTVEIRQGLAEGEAVVALAGTFVRDGDAVTPVALQTAEAKG